MTSAKPHPIDHPQISLRVAQHVVDLMNEAAEHGETHEEKIAFLLTSLQNLFERQTTITLTLMRALHRTPAPEIISRFVHRGPDNLDPIIPDEMLQEGIDQIAPLMRLIQGHLVQHPRLPLVVTASQDTLDATWTDEVLLPRLRKSGFDDVMLGAWAAAENRAMMIVIARPIGAPPFSDEDRVAMALMIRAVAPFIDREFFVDDSDLIPDSLTDRQREVLLLLLTGRSEKEVAAELHRSVHTVHTFVKQLYEHFAVTSRGELMAHFIDEKVRHAAERHKLGLHR